MQFFVPYAKIAATEARIPHDQYNQYSFRD